MAAVGFERLAEALEALTAAVAADAAERRMGADTAALLRREAEDQTALLTEIRDELRAMNQGVSS